MTCGFGNLVDSPYPDYGDCWPARLVAGDDPVAKGVARRL